MRLFGAALAGMVAGIALTWTLLAGSSPEEVPPPPPEPQVAGSPPEEALQDRLEEIQRQLEVAEFERALARGQLQAVAGTPAPWPDGLPAELGPDGVRSRIAALLAERAEVALAELDCSEYPCVAVLEVPDGPIQEEQETRAAIRKHIDTDAQQWMYVKSADVAVEFVATALGDAAAADRQSDLGFRIQSRMRSLATRAMEAARAGEPAAPVPTSEAELLDEAIARTRALLDDMDEQRAHYAAQLEEMERRRAEMGAR